MLASLLQLHGIRVQPPVPSHRAATDRFIGRIQQLTRVKCLLTTGNSLKIRFTLLMLLLFAAYRLML